MPDPPIEVHVKNALAKQPVADLYAFLINDGSGFVYSTRINGLGNGESEYLHVDNPTDGTADEADYDVVILPRSTGRADFDVSFNADPGDADAATVHNLKSSSPRTFSGEASRASSTDTGTEPSHGDTFLEDFVPGGGTGANIAGEVVDTIAFTIDAGDDKLIELRNESGGNVERIGMTVLLFEIDGTYKEIQ